jgi:uncharacterized membrane protein YhhN
MKTKILSILFFFTGLLFIMLDGQAPFFIGIVLKALIIPLLIILFAVNLRQPVSRYDWLFFAALAFSWAGDIILELNGKYGNLFIPGLICFLIAHVMYGTVFFSTPGKNIIFGKRFYLLIPVLIYGIGLVIYLYDDLGEMRLPVFIYASVILTMLAGAINRSGKVNSVSYYLVLTGAILFVLSDSAIAINKFSGHFRYSGLVIMSTYIIAQYLIVMGYIKHFRNTCE